MDRIASTARRVWCTFSSKESAEPSKMIWSKAARAAASAPVRECVWSALRKIGVGRSARRARITPAISRTPMKPRSPSDTPTKTGARSSSTALTTPLRVASSDTLKWPMAMRRRSASASVSRRFMPGDSLRGSARPALSIELDEGGEPAVKRGSAPRHQARLQHLEDLLAGGAQPEGAFHVGHESRLLRAAEGEERDSHELAHLGGDVTAVAQALLIDPVVRLHEVGILPGRELPLGVDVAARFLHAGNQRICALRLLRVRALRLRHVRTSSGRPVSYSRGGRPRSSSPAPRRPTRYHARRACGPSCAPSGPPDRISHGPGSLRGRSGRSSRRMPSSSTSRHERRGLDGERTHGGGEDPRGERQGRCPGRAARRAGRGRPKGGAGLSRLSPASLDEGSRSLHLLRDVQGRRGLRRASQGAPPGRLPRAPREGRIDRGPAGGRDLPLSHRVAGALRGAPIMGGRAAANPFPAAGPPKRRDPALRAPGSSDPSRHRQRRNLSWQRSSRERSPSSPAATAARHGPALCHEGAHVFITGRRQAELDRAVKEIGPDAVGVQGDVSNLADLDRLYAAVKQQAGRIDVLFANAGGGEMAPLGSITEASVDKMFATNVKGVVFTVQKSLPLFLDGGSIILNASVAGSKGMEAFSVYSATKAAVRSFARSWTVELKSRRVRVNAVSPGPIETPVMGKLGLSDAQAKDFMAGVVTAVPMGRMGRADEIAKAVLFLASDDSSYVTGAELFVDGGMAQI